MLHERVFEVTLRVRNAIQYGADPARHAGALLRETYEKRCYQGAFIVQILEVTRASKCVLDSTNLAAEGAVSVRFRARVAVLAQGDILVGARVAFHQQLVVCSLDAPGRPAAAVSLLAAPGVAALTEGQLVAARVVRAFHPPLQPRVAAVARLLVCDKEAPVFRLRGALDPAAAADLAPLLAAVEGELEARAALVAARRADLWFFELLLYAFRQDEERPADQVVPAWDGGPAWEGPGGRTPGGAPRSVPALVRQALAGAAVPVDGLWARPLELFRSSPLAASAPAGALPPGWARPADGTPQAVFALLLKGILDALTATREMAETFDTLELVNGHRGVWRAMREAQR